MLDSGALALSSTLSLTNVASSVNQELEQLWRQYDKIEGEVTVTKNILLEQLETLGSPQVHLRKGLSVECSVDVVGLNLASSFHAEALSRQSS